MLSGFGAASAIGASGGMGVPHAIHAAPASKASQGCLPIAQHLKMEAGRAPRRRSFPPLRDDGGGASDAHRRRPAMRVVDVTDAQGTPSVTDWVGNEACPGCR